MSEQKNTLSIELIMDGGWNTGNNSNFDPSLNRSMGDISMHYFRTGMLFSEDALEALAESRVKKVDVADSQFLKFYDIVDTEVLSLKDDNAINIQLTFKNQPEVTFNISTDEVELPTVLGAIQSARDLGLSGVIRQAYLASEPSAVRQLIENLAEEPELSMDDDVETGFVCDGHFLSAGNTAHKYAVVAGGDLFKIRGDKAIRVEPSRDQNADDDLDI